MEKAVSAISNGLLRFIILTEFPNSVSKRTDNKTCAKTNTCLSVCAYRWMLCCWTLICLSQNHTVQSSDGDHTLFAYRVVLAPPPHPPSTNTPSHVTLPSRSNQSRLPQPIFNLYPHPVNPAKKGAFAGGDACRGDHPRERKEPPSGR
ncbi:hypothetical protein CDAR_76501 [Caerostris darwini]|uniref:Uncharacterized protein n=1 Tax=Caerostris darwini TaxID=1538125 RepID=A0AAV4QEX3_9ARAC|nr:hypothetical protein CDAR_76501 [Caerostris darwini]